MRNKNNVQYHSSCYFYLVLARLAESISGEVKQQNPKLYAAFLSFGGENYMYQMKEGKTPIFNGECAQRHL